MKKYKIWTDQLLGGRSQKPPNKKKPRTYDFTGEFYHTFKHQSFSKSSKKRRGKNTSKLILQSQALPYTKSRQTHCKKTTGQIPWWTENQKSSKKILAIKRSYTMIKCSVLQGCKDSSTHTNQWMTYQINKMNDKNNYFNWCRKNIWQNSTSIHNKKSQQTECRGNVHEHKRSPQLTIYSTAKSWKLSLWDHRKKIRMATLAAFIQHSTENPSQSN